MSSSPMLASKLAQAAAAAQQQQAAPEPQPVKDMADHTVNLEGLDPALLVSQPLSVVELDALVVLKIIKHCRDSHPVTAYGQLLGLDVAGVLQVTNCFPVTSKTNSQDDASGDNTSDEMDGAEYQLQMLRCLRKLNFDASSVGLYVSTHLGSFWNQTIIENQYNYQRVYAQSVLIVYDPTRTVQGNVSLRALRLSDTFMNLFKDKKFTMNALHEHKLTASGIFESLPIRIRNSALLNAFLNELDSTASLTPLSPNVDALHLGTEAYLEKHLEYLGETVEEYGQEQWRWQGWQRSLHKEQQRAAPTIAKMRAENAARVASGKPVLYSENEIMNAASPELARIAGNEPSRLETLIITNQIDTYCKQVNQFAGPGLTKMYMAKAVNE